MSDESPEYHFVITVQMPNDRGGFMTDTVQDTVAWSDTEEDAYYYAFDYACKSLGFDPTKTYVLFWSFRLNNLKGNPS